MNWREGMAEAYRRGAADAKLVHRDGTPGVAQPERSLGFDACYWQGFGHVLGVCRCPARLAGERWGQRCVVCGERRSA